MATKYYTLYGTAKWAKVQPDQLDLNYDKKSKSWKIDLYMTPGSLEIFKQSGLQLKLREDDEGTYARFTRPEQKLIKDNIERMKPMEITDAEGSPVEVKIGNGSKVAIEISVYDTFKGKGHTLNSVVVHELVPYEDAKKSVAEDLPW
jgi:hypothetical protein